MPRSRFDGPSRSGYHCSLLGCGGTVHTVADVLQTQDLAWRACSCGAQPHWMRGADHFAPREPLGAASGEIVIRSSDHELDGREPPSGSIEGKLSKYPV